MTLFSILIAVATLLTLPKLALIDLHRSGATKTCWFDLRRFTVATGIGALSMVAALHGSELPVHTQLIYVAIAAILTLGAWIDRVSAWAPDALMLPFAIAIFLASPNVSSPIEIGFAVGMGALLFMSGIALWVLQDFLETRFITPPDIIALASPFILFGITTMTAVVFMITSILLLGALKSKRIAAIFSRPEAIADAVNDTGYSDKPSVTFLSVIFPVLLCAQIAKVAGWASF
jgi:hypothetical protein